LGTPRRRPSISSGSINEKLSWYHNGLEQRLTGFEGKGVVRELLG